mmetsp:Transcript_22533/g.31442  ORF Transcript_22533/g.31442 Transcript_22533/m.31442 type:complete len:286 (+) Transcript_22533:209-1066(+)
MAAPITNVDIPATTPIIAAGFFRPKVYPNHNCSGSVMAAPTEVPNKNFQNTTFLQNPVSSMRGPRVPTENRITKPTYSPALDATLRIRSRFLALTGLFSDPSSIAVSATATAAPSEEELSSTSSAFFPNNCSCNGWNTPNRNDRPTQNVIASLKTIPKYKATKSFCCCILAIVGHTAPAKIHNASSDTGTPKPADIMATKYARGGVASAFSVMDCKTAVAELPVNDDFEKFLTIDMAPSKTVSGGGGGGNAAIFNMIVFLLGKEDSDMTLLRPVTTLNFTGDNTG